MEYVISGLIFLAILLGVIGFTLIRGEKKGEIFERLDKLTKVGSEESDDDAKRLASIDYTKILAKVGKGLSGLSFSEKLEDDLDKADILLRIDEFIGLLVLMALGFGLVVLVFSNNVLYALIGALVGALLPIAFVKYQKAQRAALLSEEIGEALTGMSNSLRAGYSFQQAMDSVGKETHGPLGKEYRRTLREINLGVTTDQALQNLINRVQNEDLELMISSVLIQRSIGGNLAEMFDKIADTIRQRIRMKGEVKVLTAQARVSSWIIGFMPIALILVISMINPGFLSFFFESTTGMIVLAVAAVSELIGFMLIRKITNIEF
ncbi:MAG: secretion system protein [Syntrophomonadaceae bacterium]|nr:secretion system protein [Syntrophomonadaceae bacterium]